MSRTAELIRDTNPDISHLSDAEIQGVTKAVVSGITIAVAPEALMATLAGGVAANFSQIVGSVLLKLLDFE